MAKLPQNPDDDLRARGITTISMLGKRVAAMLDILYGGLYHLHSRQLRSIDWGHPTSMSLVVSEELSTFDFSLLTRLVFLAHDYAVRVAVQPAGPRHLRISSACGNVTRETCTRAIQASMRQFASTAVCTTTKMPGAASERSLMYATVESYASVTKLTLYHDSDGDDWIGDALIQRDIDLLDLARSLGAPIDQAAPILPQIRLAYLFLRDIEGDIVLIPAAEEEAVLNYLEKSHVP
jgi:hypothetical protein